MAIVSAGGALAAVALTASPEQAPAQVLSEPICWEPNEPAGPQPDGRWLDWTPDSYPRVGPRPEFAPVMTLLTELLEPFRRARALDPPPGVEVRPHRVIWGLSPEDIGPPLPRAMLMIQVFHPTVRQAGEASAAIEVTVNSLWPLTHGRGSPQGQDDQGPFFTEPRQVGQVAGAPLLHADRIRHCMVVFAAHDRPLWVPVSRERYVNALIGDLQDQVAEVATDQDDADAEVEAALRELRKLDPAAAAEAEAEMRRIRASMEAQAGGQGGPFAQAIADLEAELAAMSPAERASQAHLAGEGASELSLLSMADAPGARALVAPNLDYFDWPADPDRPQLIVVEMRGALHDPEGPLLQRLGRELDWAAFRSWLR